MNATRGFLPGVLVLLPLLAAAQSSQRYAGLPLFDALRLLQSRGLRIVFSSETVTPAMRVLVEPKGRHDRARLDALLEPHGLRIGAAHQLPHGFEELLRSEDFGRMQPAVDPDDGLSL